MRKGRGLIQCPTRQPRGFPRFGSATDGVGFGPAAGRALDSAWPVPSPTTISCAAPHVDHEFLPSHRRCATAAPSRPPPPHPPAAIASCSMSWMGIGIPRDRKSSRRRRLSANSALSVDIPPVPLRLLPGEARADAQGFCTYTFWNTRADRCPPGPSTFRADGLRQGEGRIPRPRAPPVTARRGYRRYWSRTDAKSHPSQTPKWNGRRRKKQQDLGQTA